MLFMSGNSKLTYDVILVGGGLSGCVIVSYLKEYAPELSSLLLKVGPEEYHKSKISCPLQVFSNHNTELEYNYRPFL